MTSRQKNVSSIIRQSFLTKYQFSVPSCADILLELTEKEIDTSGHRGQAAWIGSRMKIQETQ
jgi:hypothetical protein